MRNKIAPLLSQLTSDNQPDDLEISDAKDLLTRQELETLEKGRTGMRSWLEPENRIIAENRQYISKLERSRRIQRIAILASALFILIAGIWILFSQRERRSNELILEGQQLLDANPTAALDKLIAGWQMDEKDAVKTKLLYEVYRDHSFYDTIQQFSIPVKAAAFSHNGRQLAVIARSELDWDIRVIDLRSGQVVDTLRGLTTAPKQVIFSPDDKAIAVRAFDRSIRQWTFGQRDPVRYIDSTRDSMTLNTMAYSPDGNWLAIAATEDFSRSMAGEPEAIR